MPQGDSSFYVYHLGDSFSSCPERNFRSLLVLEFSIFAISGDVKGLLSQDLWCAKAISLRLFGTVFLAAGECGFIYSLNNHLGYDCVGC